MKKLMGLMAAAALVTSAGAVMAEGGAQKGQEGMQHQEKGAEKQASKQHEQLTGRITVIDRQQGNMKVYTERGQVELQFSPSSLQGYNEGDQVQLEVTIRPAKKPEQKK